SERNRGPATATGPRRTAPGDHRLPRQQEDDGETAGGMQDQIPPSRGGGKREGQPTGEERKAQQDEKREVGPGSGPHRHVLHPPWFATSSSTSRKRACSLAERRRNAAGGSRIRASSRFLTVAPLGVTTRTLTRRSDGPARLTTRPASSNRSVGSTTVEGLHLRRAASAFWEMGFSGSSWTRAQAE